MEEAKKQYAERIRRENPNAEVLEVIHSRIQEPWRAERLEPMFEKIVTKIFEFEESVADFVVRKTLLEDPEILEFQRAHPTLYYTLTDRATMKEDRYRGVLKKMVVLRQRVERGEVQADERADAMATDIVVASLGGGDERNRT